MHQKLLRVVASVSFAAVAFTSFQPVSPAIADPDCKDYEIIGARGSLEPYEFPTHYMGSVVDAAVSDLQDILVAADKSVKLTGVDYLASIFPGPNDVVADALYTGSVTGGADKTKELLASIAADCGTQTKVVLAGYSQGAHAMSMALDSLPASSAAIVAGEMLFGDPEFDPDDVSANFGQFDPERAGVLGEHKFWEDVQSAPAVSSCRRYDFFCQGSIVIRTFWGGNLRSRGAAWPEIVQQNGSNPYVEHEAYKKVGDTKKTACRLAFKMGFPACTVRAAAPPVDVAILIDTTPNSFSVVGELQSRAASFISMISNNVANSRIAVIGYGQGNVIDATDGFTSDATEAVDAIAGLEVSTGGYGSIFSAINAADALDWRPGVKKVTLTLSTSRACSSQMCSTEQGTGVSSGYLLQEQMLQGDSVRRAGVYTKDQEWFFEAAGWAQAIDGNYVSRPGGNQPPSLYIDELHRVFEDAVTTPEASPIQGTSDAVPGMPGMFSATDVVPYFSDSLSPRFVWGLQRVGDTGPRPPANDNSGGGPTASRVANDSKTPLIASPATANVEPPLGAEEEPALPDDMGPTFEPLFTESGDYRVSLDVYADGKQTSYSYPVQVWDLPTTGPAAPWLASRVDGNEQVLRWIAGDGVQPVAYGITDAADEITKVVPTDTTTFSDGHATYEYRMPLVNGEPVYSVVAFNEVAKTAALPLLTANKAEYTHVSANAGIPTGGVLEISGETTPELTAALESAVTSNGSTSLAGSYIAQLASPNGDVFNLDMTAVDASITEDNGWTMTLKVLDEETTDGQDLDALMDAGVAEEILANGHIDLQIGDQPTRIVVSPAAETSQIDEFIIDSNAPPPSGSAATDIHGSRDPATLELADRSTPELLQFISDAADPMQDWTTATVSDIRTWVGNAEVKNTLAGARIWVEGEQEPSAAGATFTGDVVGGIPNLMRDFLQTGTISFVVDGGAPTILTLNASSEQAQTMFPNRTSPAIVGRSNISAKQYEEISWQPVVNWGTSAENDRTVYLEGDLPEGLDWDGWGHTLSGVPRSQGSFPITLTAISDSGQSTKEFTLVVGASTAEPAIVVGTGNHWTEDSSGINYFWFDAYDYFQPDNPAYAASLPVTQPYAVDGYLSGPLTDIMFLDANGQPLPITGDFNITMQSQWGSDALHIESDNVTVTDLAAPPLADMLAAGDQLPSAINSED